MSIKITDLQNEKQWLLWKREWNEETQKYDKVPYSTMCPHGKQLKGSSNNPDTWDYYRYVRDTADNDASYGVGLALTKGIVVIDVDCHDNPDQDKNPLQDEILKLFSETYCEYSPSGKGVHICFCVDFDKLNERGIIVKRDGNEGYRLDKARFYVKCSQQELECYVGGATYKYMTFTGNKVSDSTADVLEDCTQKFVYFLYKYMRRNNDAIEKLLDKARNNKKTGGAKFKALFDDGDTSEYDNDDSKADLALANMLAFWLGKNKDDMRTAMYKSALDRMYSGDRKWSKHTEYLDEFVIEPAIQDCTDVYKGPGRPRINDSDEDKKQRVRMTRDILEQILTERGISLKYNIITDTVEITGYSVNDDGGDSDNPRESLSVELEDDLGGEYTCCGKKRIFDLINLIAEQNQYNPVLDMFAGASWDGEDHLNELYKALGIEDDELSKTLVLKWIWQGHILVRNKHGHVVGSEGMLVLTGAQGKGKTSFFRRMAVRPDLFHEGGKINSKDKDDQRRVITTWIAELGELDATFKRTDVGSLKGFLSRSMDEYRLAYGACDKVRPRRTNLGATVNEDIFLVDQTGNRRYWTIPANNLDKRLVWKLDTLQVWMQVWELYAKADYEKGLAAGEGYLYGFRLTDDELEQVAMRNRAHEFVPDWKILVDEILDSDYPRMNLSVGEFADEHGIKGVALKNLGEYLRACGYEAGKSNGKRVYKNLPVNPTGERAGKAYLNQTKRIKQTK